jgi:hypothetical protein
LITQIGKRQQNLNTIADDLRRRCVEMIQNGYLFLLF